MRRSLELVFLLIVGACIVRVAYGSSLQKVWEWKVSDITRESPGQSPTEISVFHLRFSPDGSNIAAVVGHSSTEEFVLILDTANPQNKSRRLDLKPNIWVDPLMRGDGITWSPSGKQIILNHILVHVSDGTSCFLQHRGNRREFFVGPDRVVTTAYESGELRLSFFGPDCQPNETQQMEGGLGYHYVDADDEIMDASAERGLICLYQVVSERWSEAEKKWGPSSGKNISVALTIVDVSHGTTVRRLPGSNQWPKRQALFADSGRLVCEAHEGMFSSTVRCWEVDTGKEIAKIKGGIWSDLVTAYRGCRVVLSDYTAASAWLPLPSSMLSGEASKRPKRVVRDIRSGEKVVSWTSKSQEVSIPERKGPIKQAYRFDISPDGEYIVEGGAGVLTLYRITR